MGDREFSVEYRVWTFGPLVEDKISVGEIMALWSRFKDQIEVIPTDGGKDFAIYATDGKAERVLKKWMMKNAPLASSALMRPEAISN